MKVKDIYYSDAVTVGDDFLAHHGIKGQRWGVRRYQNEDGTLTEAGKKKYDKREAKLQRRQELTKKTLAKMERRNRNAIKRIQEKRGISKKEATKIQQKRTAVALGLKLFGVTAALTGGTIMLSKGMYKLGGIAYEKLAPKMSKAASKVTKQYKAFKSVPWGDTPMAFIKNAAKYAKNDYEVNRFNKKHPNATVIDFG